ncbi:hypothetical protein ACEPAI_4469 [Sanghuangporus weigelae]
MTEKVMGSVLLDLLIVLDITNSMKPYMESAKDNIIEICSILRESNHLKNENGLRVGLLAYHDYPNDPTDKYSVVIPHPFTTDLKVMQDYLAQLTTRNGFDKPEAFCTALEYAYDTMEDEWRPQALKVIIVVTDAGPHGINEKYDRWSNAGGGPPGMEIRDPLEIANEMAASGFSLFVLACEPTLGRTTRYAIDFYKAISSLSLGAFCSLTDSKMLATVIIGLVLERVELRGLSIAYRDEIWRRIFQDKQSFDDVVDEVHKLLSSENTQVTAMDMGNMYNDFPEAMENYRAFVGSNTITEARKLLKEVGGLRHNPRAMKTIQNQDKNKGNSYEVTVYFQNTGSNIMQLRYFDSRSGEMRGESFVANGHIRTMEFIINIPVNFVLVCGRDKKHFNRTFTQESNIDIEQIFSQTE